ncbi:conserved Plasmodium protein, unknown function [Plasmodium knowlesi strain H]|uniref:Uncharacterized protein n=3 Tax=Plasmodium knowlesi TaxID=5850 RepID=B3L227_PLAKH|nr:conserved Plasmodium protein, unknown function [Plasmodium knowlesi strain H]OTN68345.1 Uncharacterized protein PKNOH_S03325500 [Plasmodium knowlesi]CAA9987158.1 conserved Plasmodium protein, unknown function [Plasmodium knowlesi strain H]SBO23914.1 conserved Plasmodium protein, unknown function [Plasmodium knowlesi strain H]VVS76632.1 conserved Plasmodium protein, unknown function [Plasmodium knowlesi strain H]|eukprot:XP_002261783.1 hypothetical protein, conserved in Plasmodium species [Plasmodium knowlesi strain H]
MEVVIKRPYIEVFERILKLFTSVSEHLHLRLTHSKLELIGSNNLTNELIIHLDKKFFSLGNVNCDEKVVSGSLSSKDLYHCLFSYQITRLLRSDGSSHLGNYERGEQDSHVGGSGGVHCDDDINRAFGPAEVSKLILKFNKKNGTLEVVVKFKKRNTHCSAVLKLRPFCSPLKSYVYKNESIIQVEPTLFLINLKDLANERNVFLKNTDDSIVLSAIETSDFSLNKEKIKREHFFYNNKKISIPSCKTKYFFKNKKFEDHSLALPLTDLKVIFKFCSDLNLFCLFATKNFKENVVICFGGIISQILEKNKRRIFSHRSSTKGGGAEMERKIHSVEAPLNGRENNGMYDHNLCTKNPFQYRTLYTQGREDEAPQSWVFHLSDEDNSSDEYDSDVDEIDQQTFYFPPAHGQADLRNDKEMHYNNIIAGRIHFTSYFNMSCHFNDYYFGGEDVVKSYFGGPSSREVKGVDIQHSTMEAEQRHRPQGERTHEQCEMRTGQNGPEKIPKKYPEKSISETCNIKSEKQEHLNWSKKRDDPSEQDTHRAKKCRRSEPMEHVSYPDLRQEKEEYTEGGNSRMELPSEDLNYDMFMRGNEKQVDSYFKMESKMKELQRTLDMVEKMEHLNGRSVNVSKGRSRDVAPFPNIMNGKIEKKKKRKKKAECFSSNVCERNKRGRNYSRNISGDACLPSCDSVSVEGNNLSSCNSSLTDECNSLDSDNFYSLGDEEDSLSTPSPQNKQDYECERYFNNVYSKYHWGENLSDFKRGLYQSDDQSAAGWYLPDQNCNQARSVEKRLPPRASRSSHYRRLSTDTDRGANSWRDAYMEETNPYRVKEDEQFHCRKKDGKLESKLHWMSK